MVTSRPPSDLSKNAADGKRFAVVVSRYHPEITEALRAGAVSTLESFGAKATSISTVWVPGAFEIPQAARVIAQQQEVDAIICLGAVIKGETPHNEYIAQEVARGISQVGHLSNLPVTLGVLTVDTLDQAKARSGGAQGNKGAEAAETAVSMIQIFEKIKAGTKKSGGSVGFYSDPS